MKRFTKDHEWIEVNGTLGRVGITDHAQSELGDIVYVELPEVGAEFAAGEEAAVIESVKAAGEMKNPASGKVVAVNEALVDAPSLVNDSAEGDGWVYDIEIANPAELDALMDEAAYAAYVDTLA